MSQRKRFSFLFLFLMICIFTLSVPVSAQSAASIWSPKIASALSKSPYSYFIVIGDSRTEFARKQLGKDPSIAGKVKFIGKNGQEHDYLTKPTSTCPVCRHKRVNNNQYKTLVNTLNAVHSKRPNAKIAVIINYGLNEMYYSTRYHVAPMSQKKKCLKQCMLQSKMVGLKNKYNCDLFYDSLNPIKRQPYRTTKQVEAFNSYIQQNLTSEYFYINTYKYLGGYKKCKYIDSTHYAPYTSYKILYHEIIAAKPGCYSAKAVKATPIKNAVNITWNRGNNAEGFYIYKRDKSGKFVYYNQTTSTSFIDSKASKKAYNYYFIKAYYTNPEGQREFSPRSITVKAKAKN